MRAEQGAVAEVMDRAADPEGWERWQAQARAARWCARPVRLWGRTEGVDTDTGELAVLFASGDQPDGVVLKACGCRRESVCPTCAEVYRADAYQLVAAGLRGGKGIPASVAEHQAVFATLAAPSFGLVHTRRERGPCRPGQRRECCPHGQPMRCPLMHADDDARLGEPLCVECFDYQAAVLWNASVGELWRRTIIALRRALPDAAVSYVKVVEYQRRGVVHVHAVLRLDGADATTTDGIGAPDLADALQRAAATVAVTLPFPRAGEAMTARWGPQLDVRPIVGRGGLPAGAVAAYIAKYATKSIDSGGALDRRLDGDELTDLRLRPHLRRLVDTAWTLGGRPELAALRLRAWAHTLGYRGHWLTKSRGYSTTFTALRAARADWHADQNEERRPQRKRWRYAGRGYATAGDAWLAETAARNHAEVRRAAHVEVRSEPRTEPT